jgi:hypothetical protein
MSSDRTGKGRIPQKRGDTLVGTIEKQYGVDLGHRSDKKLSTVLKETGAPSLSKLLRMADSKHKK